MVPPRRVAPAALLTLLTLLATTALPVGSSGAADARTAPPVARAATDQVVSVTGADVTTYPAFDPAVRRYAIATGPGTGGTVTVTATSTDPAAVVTVNGSPAPGGTLTVGGLADGDEVAVLVDDASGHTAYAFVYLPEKFPTLERVTPAASVPTYEHVMLTLGLWTAPSPFFETAVDANGVPAVLMTNAAGSSMDFKRQPNGHFSVARGTGNPGHPDSEVVELDEQFRKVGAYRATGLTHTDSHDAILEPDGSRWFMSYEPDGTQPGRLDAVIHHESADGTVLFAWNSHDHLDETVAPVPAGEPHDYAHINSFELMQDGHLLVSFRHFSSVFKIALHAGDGHEVGDVIWKLGGRDSSFDFVTGEGQASEGPCAQHTAHELPNGNILVFDNGSSALAQLLCVDQADPDGPPVQQVPTRIAEWELDTTAGTATLVREHTVNGRHAIFAGSAQPLAGGGEVVGWASSVEALVSELDADGDVVWELRDPAALPPGGNPNTRYFTYRAFALDLPDAIAPVVTPGVPAGATYVEGQTVAQPAVSCSDRGGSSLQTCTVTAIDTSTPGTRTVTAEATDGDGNQTTVQRTYTVVHRYRPDATVRVVGTGRVVGADRFGADPAQQVTAVSRGDRRPVEAVVRVVNAGAAADRVRLTASAGTKDFGVRLVGPRPSPELGPRKAWTVRVRIVPRASAVRGDQVRVRLVATSIRNPARRDTVWVLVRRR